MYLSAVITRLADEISCCNYKLKGIFLARTSKVLDGISTRLSNGISILL